MIRPAPLAAVLSIALFTAACGREDATTPAAETAAATTPASVPASAAEPLRPAETTDTAEVTGAAADGETVEAEASSVSISPVAAAVAANAPAPAAPAAFRWKEGQHFAPLPVAQPVSVSPGQVEVTEIFWYGCGHCFTLEPRIKSWDQNGRPDFVRVVRMPVVWNEVTREDARLFYTIEALGRLDDLHLAVFRELHLNRNPLTVVAGNRVDAAATESRVRAFMVKNGVSAEDFGKTYRGFAVENKIRQAENLSRRYLADHTPMVVVQGKFTTDVSMAGGVDQLFQLINDLAARERSAR
ncbi:MAG: thiol:disulfide interchange protein DsbA/DsbL [Steroidobacteraceae bacterium]|jgi:thiol:disulfide interchange protein DsbA|nr:thiol:disulfide interchange protein DsbA/DsbL [Steroidobacteraceae bacterium]